MYANWFKLAMNTTMLAVEAQQVIGLRMMKMATGGSAANREAQRMTSEKILAASEAAFAAASGKSTSAIVKKYRTKVRANRRRLTAR